MKYFPTLLPVAYRRAQPTLILEEVIKITSQEVEDFGMIYTSWLMNTKYQIINDKYIVFNSKSGKLNYKFKVNKNYLDCLKDAKNLLVELHLWVINFLDDSIISRNFINIMLLTDKYNEKYTVRTVPFFNIIGVDNKKLTLWSKQIHEQNK